MGTRAAIYLRISIDRQGDGLAVDRQREDCERIAAERGWTVVDFYEDSVSASKRNVIRKNYNRMVKDYAAGKFDALVCWDLDRLTRQPRQLEDWIDAAEDRGLKLVTANGEADLSTDGGRLFARIKASVARAEVERKSARQKRAAAQRADRGKAPGGVRLTGYTVQGEIVPEEARIVSEIFARFDSGDSLRGITTWLTDNGITTRRGRPWSPSSVRTILTNPRYAGRAVYCGETTGKSGNWEAIVDEATFDSVQNRLTDPRRITNRAGTDRKYLGSGLYRCGVCDSPLRSHSGSRYRCPEGGHVTKMSESVDEYVREIIRARLSLPDVAAAMVQTDDKEAQDAHHEIQRLRKRLEQIEADYDAGLIDGRRYSVATDKVHAEITKAENTRSRSSSSGAARLLSGPDPVAAFDDAPLGTQREILDLLAEVRLYPGERGRKFRPDDGTVVVTPRTAP